METGGKIYSALADITGEIGAITKSKRNTQQGFNYRGIDDVMNALNPLFSKHQVFCVPEVLNRIREERQTKNGGNLLYTSLTVRYTFYASDGSSVSAVVEGEGMDSGDKSTNKAMAVAMKYAMFQVFCIPTEEIPDPDAETPPPSVPKEENRKPVTRKSMIADAMEKAEIDEEEFKALVVRLRGHGKYADKDMNVMDKAELSAALDEIIKEAERLNGAAQ